MVLNVITIMTAAKIKLTANIFLDDITYPETKDILVI